MEKELLNINIGEVVKDGLKKKRMSQMELSQMIGVSQSLVSAWIKNQRTPTAKNLIRLAIILDIVQFLFPGYGKLPSEGESGKQQVEGNGYSEIFTEIEKLRQTDRKLEQKIQSLEQLFNRVSVGK